MIPNRFEHKNLFNIHKLMGCGQSYQSICEEHIEEISSLIQFRKQCLRKNERIISKLTFDAVHESHKWSNVQKHTHMKRIKTLMESNDRYHFDICNLDIQREKFFYLMHAVMDEVEIKKQVKSLENILEQFNEKNGILLHTQLENLEKKNDELALMYNDAIEDVSIEEFAALNTSVACIQNESSENQSILYTAI